MFFLCVISLSYGSKLVIHPLPYAGLDCFWIFHFSSWRLEIWALIPPLQPPHPWSAGVRTAGHYSVLRCAASYQHADLTEAAALVNMPAPWESSRGQDLTELLKQTCKEINKYTHSSRQEQLNSSACTRVVASAHAIHHVSLLAGAHVNLEGLEEVLMASHFSI